MPRIIWGLKKPLGSFWSLFKKEWYNFKITFSSLFYNNFIDQNYIADVLMEPIFWFVDNFTKFLGPFFVIAVTSLTVSVVIICYLIGLPFWWRKSPEITIFIFIFGHWLLLNIIFHYYMACTVSPGLPPLGAFIPEAVSICKKCIAPKPPRTHHCSVCNKCILKMDHHCPWLNNCIGFYNHRYFFMYMVFMVLGLFFIIICGLEIAYKSLYLGKALDTDLDEEDEEELIGHPVRFNDSVMIPIIENEKELDYKKFERGCVLFMALMCLGVLIALGSLSISHSMLISRGETSIEGNINKTEAIRFAKQNKIYINPYNFGFKKNWELFLGLNEGRTWLCILFPSAHQPKGNGLIWKTVFSDPECEINEETQEVNEFSLQDNVVGAPSLDKIK